MTRDLSGRVAVVTGANTGIGKETARELLARGAHVVFACRSEDKARAAMRDCGGGERAEFLALDLADLDSVRRAAGELLASERPIHILVNNAGVAGFRGQTAQGFELTFGVNHLGHFLFTTLLLDRLRASAPARIVNVSSASHYNAKGFDWAALERRTATFTALREYGVSKLANVLFTKELARRLEGTGVTTYAVHPGVIASDIWRRPPKLVQPIMKAFMRSTKEGAHSSIHCATAPELASESGGYYHANGKPRRPNPLAEDPALARELWERSEAWTADTARAASA